MFHSLFWVQLVVAAFSTVRPDKEDRSKQGAKAAQLSVFSEDGDLPNAHGIGRGKDLPYSRENSSRYKRRSGMIALDCRRRFAHLR